MIGAYIGGDVSAATVPGTVQQNDWNLEYRRILPLLRGKFVNGRVIERQDEEFYTYWESTDPFLLVEFADSTVPKRVKYISYIVPNRHWDTGSAVESGDGLEFYIMTKGTHYDSDYVV